jgi:methyltransferase (TIGR00027 family)
MAKRIERKTSRTAQYTCLSRAAAYREKRECYKGVDNIAYILVPGYVKCVLRFPWLCRLYNRFFTPRGIYEYLIARTKYIDAVFTDALKEGIDQIIIFGAGFDSRAQLFNNLNTSTRIYELDAPITQGNKLQVFKKLKIAIPENLVFVPIYFDRESLGEKLGEAGFEENRKSLFIMEGITMYLNAASIDSTFRFIRDASEGGSLVLFDYIYAGVLRQENRYYGERDVFQKVSKLKEKFTFALEEGEIEEFLSRYGFCLKNHSDAKELEKKYFQNREGKIVGKINATHGIVTAIRRGTP